MGAGERLYSVFGRSAASILLLLWLVGMVAGLRVTTAVLKAFIHREGGMVNGR